jgi:hypothetical protein
MFIGDPPGKHDRILEFSTAHTGAVFFAPSPRVLRALAEAARAKTGQGAWKSSTPTKEPAMQQYDLYLNPKRPNLGLYVRKGMAVPDLADASDWQREGTMDATEVPPDVLAGVNANGHAFQELGD